MTNNDSAAGKPLRPSTALGGNFWRLWASAGLSNIADGVVKVGFPLIAVAYTRSPVLIAGMTVAFYLPWLLFALPSGMLVDRLDRRRAMVAANTARACLLAALAVTAVTGVGSVWLLYGVAFATGAAETVHDLSAQSIVPRVVAKDHLPRANGRLYAVELSANEFVGPPLAGLLVAAGAVAAFAAPAAMWLSSVGVLLLVRGAFRPERETGQRTSMRADIAEGLRFLWRQKVLRTFTAMVAVFNFATTATSAVFVLYAVGEASAMRLPEVVFGLLLATTAAGSVAGSLAAPGLVALLGRTRALVVSFATGTLLVGAPALTTEPLLVGIGFFLGGAGIITSNIIMVSFRQRVVPDRLLGRVGSAHRFIAYGTQPLGAAAGGLLGQLIGLRAVFAVMALLALSVLIGMIVVNNDALDSAERRADQG
ncbi:MFS transporter [Saccharothrix sp. Mg75]|uniref:MFS transporter n=1 Tax=Saccharothrix sp. Mg75 TaxID=3445357 RepID=UPI003EED9793